LTPSHSAYPTISRCEWTVGVGTDLSIAAEDARDLSLIKRKLEKGDYSAARQVDEDILMMTENAKAFNGDGPVVDAAMAFERWWQGQKARLE